MTKKKSVTIYNRWLATLGGGEKTSLGIAEYLSRSFQVNVISHKPVSRDFAAERLNLDLSRIQFVTIPEKSVLELSPITNDCDLFINASHLDYFASLAKLSALLVFFPAKLNASVTARHLLKQTARTWLDMPLMTAGVCGFSTKAAPFRWFLDKVFKMRLPPSPLSYHVHMEIKPLQPHIENIAVYLDGDLLEKIVFKRLEDPQKTSVSVPPDSKPHELMLYVNGEAIEGGNALIEMSDLDLTLPKYRLFRNLFERGYKDIGYRLYYYSQAYSILKAIDTYHTIWTTSAYSKKWIDQYWRRDSEVLYPPLDIEGFRVGVKKQKILNVGRFFSGNHNKKHLEMIRAFKNMVDGGLKGWEFHMVGNQASGDEHKKYFESVCQEAAGYPIIIHQNFPHKELIDLYAESAIYWHASGFGENERQEPEKFEHFGISTVEAMASGCVPVVIGKGGQPEIVDHGENGFLWNSMKELESYTIRVIQDEVLRRNLSASAVISSKKFNRENFESLINGFIERMDT